MLGVEDCESFEASSELEGGRDNIPVFSSSLASFKPLIIFLMVSTEPFLQGAQTISFRSPQQKHQCFSQAFVDATAGQQLGKSNKHFEVTTNEELTCHVDGCVYVFLT